MNGALSTGQRFGAYLIEACVGFGGMGAVYRAIDTKLGRTVALKVIRTGTSDGPSAEVIARFLRESRVGAALAHPNIVTVFEAGAIGDTPYLAMEWVEGASLAATMSRPGTLPQAQRLDILEAMADALAHAHAQCVIHRDVKPSNVMLDVRGRARLVDFGIAKRTNVIAPGTQMLPTHARALLGTPAYMAPEQMLSPAVDARADQYSWGVMAYELLGGLHPNATVPPDGPPFPVAKPTPLNWQRPEVSDVLAAVVHRAASYEPGARFASMDELSHAWRAARGGAPAIGSRLQAAPSVADATLQTRPPRDDLATAVNTHAAAASAHRTFPPLAAPPRPVPWTPIALVVAALIVVLGGIGVALVATGAVSAASLPTAPPGTGAAGGPRSAVLEPLANLTFGAPPAEVEKAKAALETKLSACLDAHVVKGEMFSGRIFVAADGRITKVIDLQVCTEVHPGAYICTERVNAANPKRGFPTVPETVFGCLERAFVSARLPRVTPDQGEATATHDFHFDVR